jgi:ribosomal protein S18 acetylase RimI-like enzyme
MVIRPFREADGDALRRITVACFATSMHATVEQLFGRHGGLGWQQRKIADVEGDCARFRKGALVAEEEGHVVGFVTTEVDSRTRVGHIANLAVDPAFQCKGVGTALLRAAVQHLASQGMTHARIETLEPNLAGRHLYPKMGFREIARQIYYMMAIGPQSEVEATEHGLD